MIVIACIVSYDINTKETKANFTSSSTEPHRSALLDVFPELDFAPSTSSPPAPASDARTSRSLSTPHAGLCDSFGRYWPSSLRLVSGGRAVE